MLIDISSDSRNDHAYRLRGDLTIDDSYHIKSQAARIERCLKVSREVAAETRQRIIRVAGRLFREHGFDGIGVADIMKAAGLTHGGFYGHFASKDDLAAQACRQTAADKQWDGRAPSDSKGLHAMVASYLSEAHRDHPGDGCVLAALGSEVAREPLVIREAFTAVFVSRLDLLCAKVSGRSAAARRRKTLAMLSGLVGALVLSRAVTDATLSKDLLAATREEFG